MFLVFQEAFHRQLAAVTLELANATLRNFSEVEIVVTMPEGVVPFKSVEDLEEAISPPDPPLAYGLDRAEFSSVRRQFDFRDLEDCTISRGRSPFKGTSGTRSRALVWARQTVALPPFHVLANDDLATGTASGGISPRQPKMGRRLDRSRMRSHRAELISPAAYPTTLDLAHGGGSMCGAGRLG